MSKSKHVLLTIGFDQFWLPNDTGVTTLLKVMSAAQLVEKDGYGRDAQLIPLDHEHRGAVKMEYTDRKPVVPKPEPPAKPRQLKPPQAKQRLLEFKP